MPDNALDNLLPEGDDAAELRTDARAGAEAYAAAVAERLSASDAGVARATEVFLQRQARLLKAQEELLDEDRPGRRRDSRLRGIGAYLRLGLQLFGVLAATALGVGLLVMLADAFNAQSVIVDPFDAPPTLAGRGLSGKVVASRLLDQLTRLQAATHGSAVKRNLSNAWTNDIKVEVPETGVSIGDVDRMLKARFGHELHIGGDLVQNDDGGLALTVRGDGVLPKTFVGGAGELDKLTAEAAEYIYGQSEPSLFADYLMSSGRAAESVAFAKAAFATASAADRPYIVNTWADALGAVGARPQALMPLYREALNLKRDFWPAYNNLMNTQWDLGDEEDAWRTGGAMLATAGGRPGRAAEIYYQNWDTLTWNDQAARIALIADAAASGGIGTGTASDGPGIADFDQRLHDATDAEFQLQTARADAADPTLAAIAHFVHGRLALEAGNAQQADAEMEAFGAAYANPIVAFNYPGYNCWIAPAEEAAGHPDKADAVLNAGGHFVDCYRFRGDILDHRGDWAGAQRAYAAAVALAPDLPAGYYSWGLALARHGDLGGATAKLAAANARGPHWADPLKAWGDVLARQGRWGQARDKYEEALKYAPEWAALRAAAGAARGRG